MAGSTAGSGRAGTSWLPGVALEFAWRAALVGANLRQQRRAGHRPLLQTSQYRGLDPSEKSAVSFFLGQVSAKHFAEHLLHAPVFARVDEALLTAGLPLRGRRPDFYGWRPSGAVFAIEAKGRSGLWSVATMSKAKLQAQDLPLVLSGGTHTAIAHMAYFERREWKAWLLDPPSRGSQPGPSLEAVLFAYYRPFARLVAERSAGRVASAGDVAYLMAELPEVDLRLGLRRDLQDALAQPGLTTEQRGAKLRLALVDASAGQEDAGERADALLERAARLAEEETETGRSAGSDGILLEAGGSWNQEAMTAEPSDRSLLG